MTKSNNLSLTCNIAPPLLLRSSLRSSKPPFWDYCQCCDCNTFFVVFNFHIAKLYFSAFIQIRRAYCFSSKFACNTLFNIFVVTPLYISIKIFFIASLEVFKLLPSTAVFYLTDSFICYCKPWPLNIAQLFCHPAHRDIHFSPSY